MNEWEYVRTLLEEFVRMPSVTDSDMPAILAAARAAMEDLGLRPTIHADVQAVEASSGKGGVLLNGHLDTVPVASGWTKGQGVWEGDWLYGRGAADMKAGCVACLAAARRLLERGVPVSLLLTTDEETTMRASIRLASIPMVREAAAVVVTEPTGLKVIASEKGVLWYRATVRGRSAHGSMPHLGDSAIYHMGRVLPRLELYGHPKDVLSEITINLGRIQGGVAPNVVADACVLDLDCRNPPSKSKAHVEAILRQAFAAAGEEVALELYHEVPAAAVPLDAPHVRLLADLARSEAIAVTYATEMAWYAAHNPRCVVFGPGETARIHIPDERVSLAETLRAAEVLAAYGERLTVGEKSSRKL
jgi:acetylornithine deacetylase/succinyl-diaminopimelate desuccinylase-like protein